MSANETIKDRLVSQSFQVLKLSEQIAARVDRKLQQLEHDLGVLVLRIDPTAVRASFMVRRRDRLIRLCDKIILQAYQAVITMIEEEEKELVLLESEVLADEIRKVFNA